MNFEWDEFKRIKNIEKHGLDFFDGTSLFDGRAVYSYSSPRNDEHRYITIGILNGIFVSLVWTKREGAIRIISLRRARNAEREKYCQIYH